MHVKEHDKKNQPIRRIPKFSGVSKLKIEYIVEKKEFICELNNIKRPERPQGRSEVDDHRSLSLEMKSPVTTWREVKNTLEKVGVSLSKSTIKRRLHEYKYRRFTTRCRQLVTFKNRKAKLVFARKHLKKPQNAWNLVLWKAETKINLF